MSVSVRRSLAAGAVACTLSLLAIAFVPSASAPATPKPIAPPVQAQNVIVIPNPDQVSGTIDASSCQWLKTGNNAGPAMSATSASPYALLLATPLAAAVYAQTGMSGVARLYGC